MLYTFFFTVEWYNKNNITNYKLNEFEIIILKKKAIILKSIILLKFFISMINII